MIDRCRPQKGEDVRKKKGAERVIVKEWMKG
jgi:hypothetical protein